ncbi:MAG: serine/threonine dehydratase [Gemmatimonadales bacterium]|nr:L-threonine dehydratase catabolic TdcB [bacterium HR33]GIW52301.1 MAG: serine/threonine dehydratase [Gemmatimonadales bacterium]
MFELAEIESAARIVYRFMLPTPQIRWPLLCRRAGCEVWVKHENHTPIGAFKVRGGLVYLDRLRQERPQIPGVISATRGNHGQSVALAAGRHGLKATIVVPRGNSREKNRAMEALGAELVEHGEDFDEAYAYAKKLAEERSLHMILAFHPWLVLGVASYSLEFLRAIPDLDTVYVPIGQGSGICGMISVRDALGLKTNIVGVVAAAAPAYALSFAQRRAVPTDSAVTVADGVACRIPDPAALEMILEGAERIVTVSEEEIKEAMRHYFTDTHNVAEGAGAAPLAALLKERDRMAGRKVGLVLSGGNVDREVFARILSTGS